MSLRKFLESLKTDIYLEIESVFSGEKKVEEEAKIKCLAKLEIINEVIHFCKEKGKY